MPKCITSKRNGTKNNLLFLILSLIFKACPGLVIIVLAAEIFVGLMQTVTLVTWQYAVNAVEQFIQFRENKILLIVALMLSLASYIIMDLFRMILESIHTLLNNQLSEFFQSKLYDKCRVINAIHFEDSELYNEIDRANQSIGSIISFVGIIGIFIMAVSRLATLGVYVLLKKPLIAVIVVLPIVPILLARVIRGKDLYQLNFKQSENRRECSYYRECISNKETKTLLAVPYFLKKWDDLYRDICIEEKRINKKDAFIFLLLNLLKYSIYILALIIAGIYLFDGSIDVGMFALISAMLGTTHATIEVVVSKSGDIAVSLCAAKDYFSLLNKSSDILEDKNEFMHSVELNNVCFSYPDSDEKALHNISLSIRKGEKIALVGTNGAGKTTLAKIILGLYNPTHGEIWFDDRIRVENMLVESSAVFQNFSKYFFTLRENVAFGNISQINEDGVILDELAKFDFDVSKLALSLDTKLGREFEGIELSGGEWQKIALARGFIKKSEFIILDEPNSGLDPLNESVMFNRFMKLLKNNTGIIITHRIGIASLADRIILLENGRILEQGTHSELMERQGKYREMFEAQSNMYE